MLEIKNVGFSVEADGVKKDILKNVNLDIGDGFTAITGPNGGGKSTLARVVAGMITPTSGRIVFNGEDISDLSVTERARRGVSFAFQQPVKFKGLTVRDLISVAAGGDVSFARACSYLSEVGLCAKDYVDREVNASLSGGELKRIEIATVLARGTSLSIFDEPEAGIDLWSFNSLIRIFENMQKKYGGALVIISHQERILRIAKRIIVLTAGEVTGDGSPDEIMPTLLGERVCPAIEEKFS